MAKILITGSSTPDIDAVACAIGYQYYLSQKNNDNNYIAGVQNGMHPEARFVCEKLGLSCHDIQKTDRYDKSILVDASSKHGLPNCVNCDTVQEVIDHRMFPDYEAFPYAQFRVEPVGAAATQIAEFFYFDKDISISPAVAQLLLCAVYSNTVNFKANVTTFRDHRMKEWLETFVADKKFYEEMFQYKTDYIYNNLEEVMHAEDKTVDDLKLFQLELYDAQILRDQQRLIIGLMEKLTKNTSKCITIIQDIKHGQTSLIPINNQTHDFITASKLPGSWNDQNVRIMPSIMMRKTLIPYFMG